MHPLIRNAAAALVCLALVSPAIAQQTVTADDGSRLVVGASTSGGPAPQVPGSLTTLFASNNQFAGNMFDITIGLSDLTLTGIDINTTGVGTASVVDVWWRDGTSVGFENSSLGWNLIGTFTGTGAGQDNPTFMDMSGAPTTFSAGMTYGIYVDLTSYTSGVDVLRYTNGGPNVYSNADVSLTTNAGKGSPGGFSSSTFFPRQWNGTLYYDTGPCVPTLAVSNLVAGATANIDVTCATPGGGVIIAYSLAGAGPTMVNAGACGMLSVDLSPPFVQLPPIPADPGGNVNTIANVPPGTTGVSVWAQAFDIASCTLTNALALTIG